MRPFPSLHISAGRPAAVSRPCCPQPPLSTTFSARVFQIIGFVRLCVSVAVLPAVPLCRPRVSGLRVSSAGLCCWSVPPAAFLPVAAPPVAAVGCGVAAAPRPPAAPPAVVVLPAAVWMVPSLPLFGREKKSKKNAIFCRAYYYFSYLCPRNQGITILS